MIAKGKVGTSFRGALEYDLQVDKSRLIYTNMCGETPRELAAEFGICRSLRPNLTKVVNHISLSAAPGEVITDAEWMRAVDIYREEMGWGDAQFTFAVHFDTDHPHGHLTGNRVRPDGTVVSDSNSYRRHEVATRRIERELNLRVVPSSHDAPKRAPKRNEIEKALRTGEVSTRMQLQDLVDAAADGCTSFADMVDRLADVGVDVIPTTQLAGEKLSGLQYRLDGEVMKGSDLGKSYSPIGLAKRGVTYVEERDREAARRCSEREANRQFDHSDRRGGREDARSERGRDQRPGIGLGAAGSINGRADRPDEEIAGGRKNSGGRVDEEARRRAGESGQRLVEDDQRRADRAREDRAPGGSGPGPLGQRQEAAPASGMALGSGVRRGTDDGARDRIVDLAGTTGAALPGRSRTHQDLRAQVMAMSGSTFELLNEASGKVTPPRIVTRKELDDERFIAGLKRDNARGEQIYIRPAGKHSLVLVDDLNDDGVTRLKAAGFPPAAVIETGGGLLQAWVRTFPTPRPHDDIRVMGVYLEHIAGSDRGEVDGDRYGFAAGFNRPRADQSPIYVEVREAPGTVLLNGAQLLELAIDHASAIADRKRTQQRAVNLRTLPLGDDLTNPIVVYSRLAKLLLTRWSNHVDFAAMDFQVASAMLKRGFDETIIDQVIRSYSPSLSDRNGPIADRYVEQTLARAWAASGLPIGTREARDAERAAVIDQETERDRLCGTAPDG